MIRKLKISDISRLNSLPPIDWKFDYEEFLMDFIGKNYFHSFVMLQEKKIIGTGNVFFREKIGWLANIIITGKLRGKGLGSEMTKFLVDHLKDIGCETQLLIATELGEPVYKKIGFNKIADYQCYDTELETEYILSSSIRKLGSIDLEKLYQLDNLVNGENRSHFINKYYKSGFGYFAPNEDLLGFYLPDFGRGLVLAKEAYAGLELLKLKHSKKGKRTLLPLNNKDGITFFEANHF